MDPSERIDGMRIAQAEVIPYQLPFRREYVTSRGRLERREMVLLRLVDDEGREGWGEAVPLSLRGGADLARVTRELKSWTDQARGRSLLPHGYLSSPTLEGGLVAGVDGMVAPARCAVLTALADLEARRREMPVWQLLGARHCEPIHCNATLVSGPPQAVAEDARRWAADGFSTFKLKVGLVADGPLGTVLDGSDASPDRPRRLRRDSDSDPDIAQVRAVREAVGETARLRLDANGTWTVDRAEAVLGAAAPLGIELIEQPVASLAELSELSRRLHRHNGPGAIPIAADESVNGSAEARALSDADACSLATVKLSKTGQIRPNLDGALPFYLSSALDGPVGIAAAAHAYQAMSPAERAALPSRPGDPAGPVPLAQGLATQRLFAITIASQECELRGPLLHLPPGPGLGIEIDRAALEAHRL